MRGRFSEDGSTAVFGSLNVAPAELRQIDRFLFCACSTAWHACLVTEPLVERFARVPVEIDFASEFRYRNAPLHPNTLFFVISQSGETIDALAALGEAKRKGYRALASNNVVGSTLAPEGALKLKEISHLHAEGYPAAEMKHGPIALLSKDCPRVCFAQRGGIFSKIVSAMQEIKARGGPIIVVATGGSELPPGLADEVITIPACHEAVLPIVAAIPVQLLSYYIAVERGCDVDKPRNLAKSVTVE